MEVSMRPIFVSLFLALLALVPTAKADNTLNDVFTVTAVNGAQATLTGKVESVKAGDSLYFIRSPFKFKVLSAGTNSVVIELPPSSDVVVSNTMVRNPTPTIKKALETESKLKSALSD
jgi:hypothetical protein